MIINTTPPWHHSRGVKKIRWLNHKQITHTSHTINFLFFFFSISFFFWLSRKKNILRTIFQKKEFSFYCSERKVINITQFFLYKINGNFLSLVRLLLWRIEEEIIYKFFLFIFPEKLQNFSLPLFIYREMPYRGKEKQKKIVKLKSYSSPQRSRSFRYSG